MIYVVTGIQRSGTTYLTRCLTSGGCTLIRYRRHRRFEIRELYYIRDIEHIINVCTKQKYDPSKDYCVKIFQRYFPYIHYHPDIHPIMITRDAESLKVSLEKAGMIYPWAHMGQKYLDNFYEMYFNWLSETWPCAEKVVFPNFEEWIENTTIPAKAVPYKRKVDG